ncbi:Methyl-accepting chemotaxis protein domain-containing protein [Desulfonema limicola]|uniref:Methyl-accepting chemotaxis protein domain-containing protein n=1 Tax=Desulfonema limicola TaxID=45656 RepID=A0A975GHN4_9BACT|nr:hypothetical protein [Desulfonema limicola]QTA81597.1 Methyl-accepting chemotaxis protein domain-containing protein [Desulfonema limicola]
MINRISKYFKSLKDFNPLKKIFDKLLYKISFLSAYKNLSELSDIQESLGTVMTDVEPEFLELGQRLQQLYADSDQLTQQAVNAASFIGGKNTTSNFLSKIDLIAKQALSDLQYYQNNISENLAKTTASLEYLSKLINICSIIEKTGISLNVIGLNIAIESSRSEDSGEMFASFTDEIRQLSKKISEISKNILDDSQTTRLNQISANTNILKGLETFEHLYYKGEKVVKKAIRDIFKIMEISMNVFEKSNHLSREISSQVGEVVVGIQFHDIARQKIEHIIMALNDIEDIVTSRNQDSKAGKDEILGRSHKIIGLQASQLREVINEIRNAYKQCRQAFNQLGHLVGELVADVSVFDNNADDDETRLRKRITALKSGLEQLGNLLFTGRDLEHQINENVEQVSDTASKLSAHIDQVRGISLELHLKALNAIVKSAKLEHQGRALEILAQEVSKLSGQSDLFVTDVVKILESLVSTSDDLDKSLYSHNGSEQETHNSVAEGISEIGINYERFKTEASLALEKSHSLQADIIETGSSLIFLNNLADKLELYLGKFESIIQKLEPWADDTDENGKKKIDQVAHRYTMASERLLHHKHFNQTYTDKEMITKPEEFSHESYNYNKDSDIPGDNIELFDSDEPPESDNKEISESNELKTNKPEADKNKQEDMGDNVELF